MRSSIACARCRRSKVKCVNNGVGTTCRACETTGRECTYPVPSFSSGAIRRDVGASRQPGEVVMNAEQYTHIPRKPRPKKQSTPTAVSTKESMRALVDALDPNILTPQVWIELFEIWQLHYSADLPYLHPPTFLQPLRQIDKVLIQDDFNSPRSSSSSLPPASPLILLAFLALTARFHDKLVAHHSPPSTSRPSNPLIACQYYASACKARLAGNSGDGLGIPDADRIQALGMLSLHDWGNCTGQKAWVQLGVAIRYAQALGLQYQEDLDDEPQSSSQIFPSSTSFSNRRVNIRAMPDFVEEETKRRIFWGLFILDRYLSSGKYRPQMIRVDDVRLQLPSSERSFLFGEKVRTAKLDSAETSSEIRRDARSHSPIARKANGDVYVGRARVAATEDEQYGRWETGSQEGVVSRYVKAIDLYGTVIKWSCSGGRRRDREAPWEPTATWNKLNFKLNQFTENLPRDLALSPGNIHAHITSRTSTPFLLMHSALLLSRMMLHREYIPFIPLRCNQPQGPLDPPLFTPEQYRIPRGFWDYSAAEMFKAARELIDLVQTCREWNVLPQTPIVGFSIYVAAFIGVYAINFPWMDPHGYMCKEAASATSTGDESGAAASRHALSLVAFLRPRLRMADGWFKTIHRVHRYYVRVKKEFQRNINTLGGPRAPPGPLSIQEGGIGGGLEEFKMIESTLKEFGALEDLDVEMADVRDGDINKAESSGDAASIGPRSDSNQAMADRDIDNGPPRYDRWNAINSATTTKHGTTVTVPTTNGAPNLTSPVIGPSGQQSPLVHSRDMGNPQSVTGGLHRSTSAQSQLTAPTMTIEQMDVWLRELETPFSGDDLTAFVEGKDWSAWLEQNSSSSSNWLSTIWSGPIQS